MSQPLTAAPTGGYAATLVAQVKSEVVRSRRIPEYLVGIVVLPLILYAMFGLTNRNEVLPSGLHVSGVLVFSFGAYGVVSQSLFSFGADLAEERGQGWLRRMRATPMPMSVYFGGKLAMNLIFSVLMLAALIAAGALLGDATFHWPRALAAALVCVSGAIWFAPMGAAIAYWVRPKAATTIVNLVFLPLAFLSGFFMPINSLPSFLQQIAPFLPTYHFGALTWRTLTDRADLTYFMDNANQNLWVSAAIVVGWFLLALALFVAGYRREGARQRR